MVKSWYQDIFFTKQHILSSHFTLRLIPESFKLRLKVERPCSSQPYLLQKATFFFYVPFNPPRSHISSQLSLQASESHCCLNRSSGWRKASGQLELIHWKLHAGCLFPSAPVIAQEQVVATLPRPPEDGTEATCLHPCQRGRKKQEIIGFKKPQW